MARLHQPFHRRAGGGFQIIAHIPAVHRARVPGMDLAAQLGQKHFRGALGRAATHPLQPAPAGQQAGCLQHFVQGFSGFFLTL